MKFISADEARKISNQELTTIRTALVERVLTDINYVIRVAAEHGARETNIDMSQWQSAKKYSYNLSHPLTFWERFSYNWNEGQLSITLNESEMNSIIDEIGKNGFSVRLKDNFHVATLVIAWV